MTNMGLSGVEPITNCYNHCARDTEIYNGISLRIDDPEMLQTVKEALDLMADVAPDHLQWVQYYIKEINEATASGMHVETGVFDLNPVSVASPEWTASIIFHDAVHAWQYQSNVPHTGAAAEADANARQLGFLESIGGSQSELDHLRNVIAGGDHSDLNGDGVYNIADYAARNW